MALLMKLECLRNPVLDLFFLKITTLGEEAVFVLIGLIFLWCIDKKKGFFILSVSAVGLMINQFLKILFHIPRPWIKNTSLSVVEGAKLKATGYSFPSGHTQISTGLYGSIARVYKGILLRILCVLIVAFVAFSRMYLGVHTPQDVFASLFLACLLIFLLYPVIYNSFDNHIKINVFYLIVSLLNLTYILYLSVYNFSDSIENVYLNDSIKNAYRLFGSIVAFWISYNVDRKFINYKTDAVWWAQILKVVCGVILLFFISLIDKPLDLFFDGNCITVLIRYFLLVIFIGCVWPAVFKYFPSKNNK